jgi:hypothetical protein
MQRPGFTFRIEVNGSPYAVASSRFSSDSPALNTSNTEGIPGNPTGTGGLGTSSCIADIPTGQVELRQATFDDSNSPYAAPIAFQNGLYYNIVGLPTGSGGNNWDMDILLTNITHEASVPGAQPVTVRGQSDGRYNVPG